VLVVSGLALVLSAGLMLYAVVDRDAGRELVVLLDPPGQPPPLGPLEPDTSAQPLRIRSGSTFGGLVARYDLSPTELRSAAIEHYDLARIRPDRELLVTWRDGEPDPVELSYEIDEDRRLDLTRTEHGWSASLHEIVYAAQTGSRAFEIRRSLWQDGLAAGLRPAGLVRLAQVFEYELDFNTELQPGAAFSMVAEVLSAPGRADRLGDIHAVRLVNGSRAWTVFRYVLPDGVESWYREDGTSLRKPFLRSPLEFSRVTSGFNPRRFHPILKRPRPHNGTDFGAPTGTPVRVVADGKVVRSGRAGGHGLFVKVEHDGGYATSYSHLSRIGVKAGARVRQGQVIGAVGATGLATGPHLHYQMWKNGRFVDPMRIDLPNQAPLPASERAGFAAAVARWLPELERAAELPGEPPASPDDAADTGDPPDGLGDPPDTDDASDDPVAP